MDNKILEEMLEGEQLVQRGAPCAIAIQGKTYKVKQISNTIRRKISDLEKEVLVLEKESKREITLKRAKQIDRKIRTLHSKTAAYYLLGNWALFVPFLWAIKWRLLDLKDSEVTFTINAMGANNKGVDFFLANWQITKAQLALSMRLVGEGIKQYQERMESAEDALTESPDSK
jgi:hypothetical protein